MLFWSTMCSLWRWFPLFSFQLLLSRHATVLRLINVSSSRLLVTWTGDLARTVWCSTGVKSTMKWATPWTWWASRNRWNAHNKLSVLYQTARPQLLRAYKCSRLALLGKGRHDDYPGRDPVSGKYHLRADRERRSESERDFERLAQSHRGESLIKLGSIAEERM